MAIALIAAIGVSTTRKASVYRASRVVGPAGFEPAAFEPHSCLPVIAIPASSERSPHPQELSNQIVFPLDVRPAGAAVTK